MEHGHFRKHYPDGYRMDFVSFADAGDHEGLKKAIALYESKTEEEKTTPKGQMASVVVEFSGEDAP